MNGPLRVECAQCSRPTDVDGNLLTNEELQLINMTTEVTQGLCNDCGRKLYPNIAESLLARAKK